MSFMVRCKCLFLAAFLLIFFKILLSSLFNTFASRNASKASVIKAKIISMNAINFNRSLNYSKSFIEFQYFMSKLNTCDQWKWIKSNYVLDRHGNRISKWRFPAEWKPFFVTKNQKLKMKNLILSVFGLELTTLVLVARKLRCPNRW